MIKYIIIIIFILALACQGLFAQDKWIPIQWYGDSLNGRYYPKLAMFIPINIENLTHNFTMQLDLGAINTLVHGNAFSPYLDAYPSIKSRLDSSVLIQGDMVKIPQLKNIHLTMGEIDLGNHDLGFYSGYGNILNTDSVKTVFAKFIGTLAPDVFQDKYLILDYKNDRLCITRRLNSKYKRTTLIPIAIDKGRIKVPVQIGNLLVDLLFDTGVGIFELSTTEANAANIASKDILDSFIVPAWSGNAHLYAKKINKTVKMGDKVLGIDTIYFTNEKKFQSLFSSEHIWGILGSSCFHNNVIIIDYRNKRIGLVE